MANLILHNATVITLEPSHPVAQLVAVEGGRIQAVGDEEDLPLVTTPGARIIDCGGGTLIPAFHDAHCHLLALAASFMAADCSPWVVPSIEEIQAVLRRQAEVTQDGQWVRARGYHEARLREARHPTRYDLDQAVPSHPVKLIHQSGHASVLNSPALVAAGIGRETPDPPEGVIERDPATGEPTGLLLEMEGYLEQRLPVLSAQEIERGLKLASAQLLSHGVTAMQDASPGNSLERWGLFEKAQGRGTLPLRLTLMPGIQHLEAFQKEGLGFGSGSETLRLGHAKVMLTLTTGDLYPPQEELQRQALEAVRRGFPLAVHAVEMEAVVAAVAALRHARTPGGSPSALRHRIEHASECPSWLAEEMGRQNILVATQPGFLFYNGDRYRQEVPTERQAWLYPLRWLLEAGVVVAGSSDAPVVPVDPLGGIYAAVTRRTSSGERVNPGQGVTPLDALRMYTVNAAYVGHWEGPLGSIAVGKAADLVLLDRNPLAVEAGEMRELRVLMTLLGGEVVWEG